MPVCRECKKEFPNRAVIDGKIRVINNRKYCLDCLPFGSGRKPYTKTIREDEKKKCSKCLETKKLSCFYKYKKQNKYQSHCKECQKKLTRKRIQDFKDQCVKYKGGRCLFCGYSKCNGALDFHHEDPKKKEFKLSDCRTRSWEKVKEELDKCILLCSNCHRELMYVRI